MTRSALFLMLISMKSRLCVVTFNTGTPHLCVAEAAFLEELEKNLEAFSDINIDDLSPGFVPISPVEGQRSCSLDPTLAGSSRRRDLPVLHAPCLVSMETENPSLVSTQQQEVPQIATETTMPSAQFSLSITPVPKASSPQTVAEMAGELRLFKPSSLTMLTPSAFGSAQIEVASCTSNAASVPPPPASQASSTTLRRFETLPFKPSDVGRTVCEYCNRDFVYPARLLRHRRVHTGERPFKCEFCSKSFTQKVHLKLHTRVHTGERPFKCDRCVYAACDVSALRKHMVKHSSQERTQQAPKHSQDQAGLSNEVLEFSEQQQQQQQRQQSQSVQPQQEQQLHLKSSSLPVLPSSAQAASLEGATLD